MGTQTMASQSGSSGSSQQSQIQSLSRQGSLTTLTLSEVHNNLGEPLHSLNFADHLKSVFPAATNQPLLIDFDCTSSQYAGRSGLQRQGSTTMLRSLNKKTVDEVWKDIRLGKPKGEEEQDFLVKAGVDTEGIAKDESVVSGDTAVFNSLAVTMSRTPPYVQGSPWLRKYELWKRERQMQGQDSMTGAYMPSGPVPQPLSVGAGHVLDSVLADSSPSFGALSDSQTPGGKRGSPYDTEDKQVEKKQKRMIKIRQSAARSSARKQAYANELKSKVIHLEEENEKLKKQQA